MTKYLQIIGDIHGKYEQYLQLISDAEYSIQLGDFGFDYSVLDKVDSRKHKIIPGNHDNYNDINRPHFLGNFGIHTIPFFSSPIDFFFIRGAYSVDKKYRIEGVSWWPEEELNFMQQKAAYDAYCKIKPNIVLSHDCPFQIAKKVVTHYGKLNFSNTTRLLSACFHFHQPGLWIFGHHHNNKILMYKGTRFICLNELSTLDFSPEGKILF